MNLIPRGWYLVFDFCEGHIRIVNPVTGEWRLYP